ncbi:MAG: DUF6338 family protein [bacterium]|nr:DUF6338 family protein [bacterium]
MAEAESPSRQEARSPHRHRGTHRLDRSVTAPRAWDHLFQDRPAGGVRCKLKSGTWIGGIFGQIDGRRPYAAGYPESQDLYLRAILSLDPDSGEINTNADGNPEIMDSGILIRWEEIEYLEFTEAAEEEQTHES